MSAIPAKQPRIDVARIRREQIVEAAVAVIIEKGLPRLTLSEIEAKVGMSRGQLTYYFKTKEDILLAVFDHLLEMMCRQHGQADREKLELPPSDAQWEEMTRWVLDQILSKPGVNPEFHCLQYTFLAQSAHRQDFRKRLATLYEEWRSCSAELLARELTARPPVRAVNARALATVVQAILHGLVMQLAADPTCMNKEEVLATAMDMLRTYLWGGANGVHASAVPSTRPSGVQRKPGYAASTSTNGGTHA